MERGAWSKSKIRNQWEIAGSKEPGAEDNSKFAIGNLFALGSWALSSLRWLPALLLHAPCSSRTNTSRLSS